LDVLPTEMEANPEGCQMVGGGRSPLAPNDPRKAVSHSRTLRKGARPGRPPATESIAQ
jgi:hypothetical protein